MSKVMRSVKNVTKGYSSAQVKVREATSNDPWGPTGTQMSEIAQMTYNTSTEFYEIMDMIDKRLNDKGKNWRHVLKALKVLDYCLHEGSELVVTWARQSIYIIKTLREFQYVDEEGRDVGQNVRVAAKELTALILDEDRLRAERSDRRSWKSRVTGLEEFAPQHAEPAAAHGNRRQRERRVANDEEDTEYRLAIEASKYQEEEDRKKRESRQHGVDDDDDLQKAIKLSQEEEEKRRKELEESNAHSLFDDDPVPQQQTSQPQYTGFNQGYQQGNPVDFFANPIDQNQPQNTGYMANAYTGFPQQGQPTGFQTNLNTGFGQPMNMDPYGQQQAQQQAQQQQLAFQQPQPTGFNPYLQQQPQQPQQSLSSPASPEPTLQPGSNNPWATHNQAQALQPTPTGSNNPFAQFSRPQSARPNPISSLGSLPEQKTLNTFSSQPQLQQQNSFPQAQPAFNTPQKEMNEHETRLNSLLATGDGMDTFGNTGNLRIPAQHTAPGTFVNSAGAGVARINAEATGNNPFLRQQFTGMPTVNYGPQMPAATGPAGLNGQTNNPFAAHPAPQQQQQNQDLIQF
ncbi:ENTH domain-containing protein [Fusarium keratoplasticum]|uniref:ENTH domain-containing protein n=1 Tax=Fusarium keratoplasticum TaxID=1328300 RepID=A0ACC0R5W1_9HYPO|nr:ENTH domain-containing protein [Fusarium keratoplasticum]KAI8674855.1 ENTH domain-containing protein [Fusarium keratoplasticum]